jgi:DNA repair exonuclease SbcCD ATPase subunit
MLEYAEEGAKAEETKNALIEEQKEKLQLELKEIQLKLKVASGLIQHLSVDIELLEYAKKAFQRNGISLLLCQDLCPILNSAAEYYSELFFDSKQCVRFLVTEGEFTVDVLNGAGSETVDGQSTGEAAMAGIVAALSLREACPKTNLLILDEPGHGLDSVGARAFAKGLLKLKKKFATILVTTHSPVIAAELEGEVIWTVIKEQGISKLIEKSTESSTG